MVYFWGNCFVVGGVCAVRDVALLSEDMPRPGRNSIHVECSIKRNEEKTIEVVQRRLKLT
jgi:hypothetical protein